MTSSLPSPSSKPNPDTSTPLDPALASRLDDLLARYLDLLDTYDTLRKQLSFEFSSGFFSLAHANRNANSTLGAGRRYGEEGYDQRMKASRGVEIRTSRLQDSSDVEEDGEGEEEGNQTAEEDEAAVGHNSATKSSQSIPEAAGGGNDGSSSDHKTAADDLFYLSFSTLALTETMIDKKNDPLRWYGVLVPPALRQCQSTFTTSVTTTIPSLLTTTSQMRALEDEIWHVRKQLGILNEYQRLEKTPDDAEEGKGEPALEQPLNAAEKAKEQASSKKGLPNLVSRSRPSEPRSRVLKMD